MDNYNRTVHSSTKLAPIDVDARNARYAWNNLYAANKVRKWKPFRYREGEFMRTSKLLSSKDKRRGELGNKSCKGIWSRGVYTVIGRRRQTVDGVAYYALEDWGGDRVKGRFYEPQLQKVEGLPNRALANEKFKYRGRGADREVQVNWQGLAPDYKTWVPVKNK